MKHKILIEFTGNPIVGNAFSYEIKIGGVNLIYPSGLTVLDLQYVSGATVPYESIGIKSTMYETIDATLNFLVTYYNHPNIVYTKINDSIEAIINIENVVITYPEDANEEVLISDEEYDENDIRKLKYYSQYYDPQGVEYLIRIFQKSYTGSSIQVCGTGKLQYGSAKNNLDPIRGNGLDLNLEADTILTLEDLYTEEENIFTVKFYRANKLLFDGFLKPDGIYQSFVYDRWMLNLTCVDGLGILKDLAFVQPSGLPYIGKQKAIDIIYNCLRRTNLSMNINTSVNIYYEGLTPSDTLDPLSQIYMSVDRFIKDDNDTIMDCQKVLSSVLNVFNANIAQIEGQWYIYRANEIVENSIVKFRQYSKTNNGYLGLNTKNLAFDLGSHINNYYPHHANANQQIEIKGSISAARLNYKYGFIQSLNKNKDLKHTGYVYDNWIVINQNRIILNPSKNYGLLSSAVNPNVIPLPIIKTEDFLLDLGTKLEIKIKANKTIPDLQNYAPFVLRFEVKLDTLGTDYWLFYEGNQSVFSWETTQSFSDIYMENSLDFIMNLPALPADGNLTFTVYQAYKVANETYNFSRYELTLVDIINRSTTNAKTGAIGEFHTVQRQNRPSSISKETTEIFNGDSPTLIYEGAIFKIDQETPTSNWFRRGKTESKPILRIAAEDILRMSQKPQKLFTGDVYGFLPYLSVVTIDNVEGKFMPIEWSFDSKANITTVKLLEAFNAELTDIDYKYTLDYGNTVKPTITS